MKKRTVKNIMVAGAVTAAMMASVVGCGKEASAGPETEVKAEIGRAHV